MTWSEEEMKMKFSVTGRTFFRGLVLCLLLSDFLFFSCSPSSSVDDALSVAELKMNKKWVSALDDMCAIDKNSLKSDRQKALYALLMTQALDKSDMLTADDTLIYEAVDYFDNHRELRYRMMSQYYLGQVYILKEDFSSAIMAFMKSMEFADRMGDSFWKGMAARGLSDVYCEVWASDGQLKYALVEEECFRIYGEQPYLYYAMGDLAHAYGNSEKFGEAQTLLNQLTDSAMKYGDEAFLTRVLAWKGSFLIREGKIREGIPFMEQVINTEYAVREDSSHLALAYAYIGQTERAMGMLDALSASSAVVDSMSWCKIYKQLGMTENALEALERSDADFSRKVTKMMETGLSHSVNDFFEWQRQRDESEHKFHRLRLTALSVSLALLLVILVCVFQYRGKQRRIQMMEHVLLAEKLQRELSESREENRFIHQSLDKILPTWHTMFRNLCDAFVQYSAMEKRDKLISKTVESIIENLSMDGKGFADLVEEVNLHHNNLYSDFRRDFPNQKEIDYRLFLFNVLGYPSSVIALLLKVPVSTVYNRKRHMKERLSRLSPSGGAKYLAYLR